MPRLPKGVRWNHGAFYLVKKKRKKDPVTGHVRWPETWIRLGEDAESMRIALAELRGRNLNWNEATTLSAFALNRWLPEYVENRRKGKTAVALARQRFTQYVEPELGTRLMAMVGRGDLLALLTTLRRAKSHRKSLLSPQSVAHIMSDVRCLLSYAESVGAIDRSPWARDLMPSMEERPPDRLSDVEAARLARLPDPFGFLCRLAMETGFRWGELARVRAEELRVSRYDDLRFAELPATKTKSGRVRWVPISEELESQVRARDGRLCPFSERSLSYVARRIRELANLPSFHVHQLRHTAACQLLESGASLAAVQSVLGHGSVRTTQRYAGLGHAMVAREVARARGRFASNVGGNEGGSAEVHRREA